MRHVLLTAGLLLGPVVAGAQQVAPAAPAGLSLADAIAIARDKNPAYRQVLNDRGPAAWGCAARLRASSSPMSPPRGE